MADQEHLEILLSGVENWNRWREEHPDVQPDLQGANLQHANLRDANLRDANLQKANLQDAILRDANLQKAFLLSAILQDVDLWQANLLRADLQKAFLLRADLQHANLLGANLQDANLRSASLVNANLRGADLLRADLQKAFLQYANLQDADFQDTRFDSLQQLNGLAVPLTPEQLMGCRFAQDEEADQEKDRDADSPLVSKDAPRLALRLPKKNWRPIDVALAMLALEALFNRMQTLCESGLDLEELQERLAGPCYPEHPSQGAQITALQRSSLDVTIAFPDLVSLGPAALAIAYWLIRCYARLQEGRRESGETHRAHAEAVKFNAEAGKLDAEAERTREETRLLRLQRMALERETRNAGPDALDAGPDASVNGLAVRAASVSLPLGSEHETLPPEVLQVLRVPAHTASRCNGLPPEQNETLLRLFVVPTFAPLFGPSAKQGPVEVTPQNFDPETVLDPRDFAGGPFGPDPDVEGGKKP